ncbi:MAG: HAMP domain-containing protein [Candidatus Omnitrophica bacterium]|nr:HAMP domain-containing protein [Candidatus Omnitrophota bacterium]
MVKSVAEDAYTEGVRLYELDNIADSIGRDLRLRVTIIGLGGTVYGDSELEGNALREVENHYNRPEIREALEEGRGQSRRFSTTVEKNMLYVATVLGEDEPYGVVRLSIPLSEIKVVTARVNRILLFSFLFAFFIIAIATFLFSKFISRPLKEMVWNAKNVARGDFSHRLVLRTGDEIEELAKAFNYMSNQIKIKIEEAVSSRSRMEAVLLSMFEGVMVVDSKGAIVLINKTLREFFDVTEDARGKTPIEVIRNIEIQDFIHKALTAKEVLSKEISILSPQERILLIHASSVLCEGKNEGAVLVFHDITELRRLERVRRDFIANVSHELRTPVTNIKGYAETLLAGAIKDKENCKDFVKIIYDDSEKLAGLIDDILDLSRIESGRLRLQIKPCRIADAVKKVLAGLKKEIKEKSLEIEVYIPENIPSVMADERALIQIIFNLVSNAVRYNNERGSVKISARKDGKNIIVSIGDTGIGISEKDLPRIFERFYCTDKGRSREAVGTGLGLSIVKHLVQAQGGGIVVESMPGQGSVFEFSLPKS